MSLPVAAIYRPHTSAGRVGKLSAQTVAQLKELCALQGLRKTGSKAELVERLLVALYT